MNDENCCADRGDDCRFINAETADLLKLVVAPGLAGL
jgi:hypothetical protein